jgi:hypothetical protein
MKIEMISRGFRSILAQKAGNDPAERCFSKGGIVLTPRRSSTLPTRAGKQITSAVRYSAKNKPAGKAPVIPEFGVIRRDPTAVKKDVSELDDLCDPFFTSFSEALEVIIDDNDQVQPVDFDIGDYEEEENNQ